MRFLNVWKNGGISREEPAPKLPNKSLGFLAVTSGSSQLTSTLEIIMSRFWSKSRTGKVVEGGLNLLDSVVTFGLVSGAAVVLAFGKLLLGGVLSAFALGVFARMCRRTKSDLTSAQEPKA